MDHCGSREEQLTWFIFVAPILAASPLFGLLPKQVNHSTCILRPFRVISFCWLMFNLYIKFFNLSKYIDQLLCPLVRFEDDLKHSINFFEKSMIN